MDVRPSNMDNANTKEYLDKIRSQVIENLRRTGFAPSVQMTDVPRDPLIEGLDDEADAIMDDLDDDENKDKRYTKRRFDQYIEKTGELSDSEDEEENAANGVRRQPGVVRRRNHISHRNLDASADSGLDSGIATPREASAVPDQDEDMDLTADRDADMPETSAAPEAESHQSPFVADAGSKVDENLTAEIKDTAPETTTRAGSPASALSEQHSDVDMEDINTGATEAQTTSLSESVGQEKTPPASPPTIAAAQEPHATATSPPAAAGSNTEEEMKTKDEDDVAADGSREEDGATAEVPTKSEEESGNKDASEATGPEKVES